MKYLKGSILNLVECCLCLSDVFDFIRLLKYATSIYIEGPRTKIVLVVYQKNKREKIKPAL